MTAQTQGFPQVRYSRVHCAGVCTASPLLQRSGHWGSLWGTQSGLGGGLGARGCTGRDWEGGQGALPQGGAPRDGRASTMPTRVVAPLTLGARIATLVYFFQGTRMGVVCDNCQPSQHSCTKHSSP